MHDWLLDLLQEMGATLRLPTSFVVIEFIGTFAFAISGVRLSSAKRYDIFGAWIVGMATAIGGGTIRDLLLGVDVFWMTNGSYFICCALAVLWVMWFGKYLIRQDNTWFLFDTIGLALFNVIGIEKTLALGHPYWVAITMGAVTGAGGGIIRDVCVKTVPMVFRKRIYAVASLFGGICYYVMHVAGVGVVINTFVSMGIIVIFRVLAIVFRLHLPKAGVHGDLTNDID